MQSLVAAREFQDAAIPPRIDRTRGPPFASHDYLDEYGDCRGSRRQFSVQFRRESIMSVRAPLVAVLLIASAVSFAHAQQPRPSATLIDALPLDLPGSVDSNSPVVWALDDGLPRIHVTTSSAGQPSIASGWRISRMMGPSPVAFTSHPGHGVWMEAVVADDQGTWYGYYHNEIPADVCDRPDLLIPRIGAARSVDRGATWEDLGIILEAPPGREACATSNTYFAGGVGDFSAILAADSSALYIFFTQYSASPQAQGIAVARLPWSARDQPGGRVEVWAAGAWLPAIAGLEGPDEEPRLVWRHQAGSPLVVPSRPWHDEDGATDAFWGPSVHWNTALQRYVMLLNRTKDDAFAQDGIYVSYATTLENPSTWSLPTRLLDGGNWYPQVIGVEVGEGTDKLAGGIARLFISGRSTQLIRFDLR